MLCEVNENHFCGETIRCEGVKAKALLTAIKSG